VFRVTLQLSLKMISETIIPRKLIVSPEATDHNFEGIVFIFGINL
jgi:hypothetical protein